MVEGSNPTPRTKGFAESSAIFGFFGITEFLDAITKSHNAESVGFQQFEFLADLSSFGLYAVAKNPPLPGVPEVLSTFRDTPMKGPLKRPVFFEFPPLKPR